MAKFIFLWRFNPVAPWPTDPVESAEMMEMMFAASENLVKAGAIQERGYFLNATSGYSICTGESKDQFRTAFSFYPFIETEVHEIVPDETAKEIMRGAVKAQAEAREAMKR